VRKIALTAASVLTLAAAAAPALAAPNPAGTGEPGTGSLTGQGVSCPTTITSPNGFNSGGFSNAGTHYANPGTTSGAPQAVSEYDIACYQTSQTH
jgi:hypothetical protein